MAHQITGGQPRWVAAQIGVQSRHLAGGAGKEHLPPGFQVRLHLAVGAAGGSVHIFAALQSGQLCRCIYPHQFYRGGGGKGRTVGTAAAFYHLPGQHSCRTAGGGTLAHLRFYCVGSQRRAAFAQHGRVKHRANAAALAAAGAAALVDHRHPVTGTVQRQGNAVCWAGALAGAAAGAALFRADGHRAVSPSCKNARLSATARSRRAGSRCRGAV